MENIIIALLAFSALILGAFLYLLRRERRPLSEEELAQREENDLTQ